MRDTQRLLMTDSQILPPGFGLLPTARDNELLPHHLAEVVGGRANGKYPHAQVLPLRDLVGTSRIEYWTVPGVVAIETHAHFSLHQSGELLFGALAIDEQADLATATEHAYGVVLAHNRRLGFPHLLRVWNYFGDINAGDGDNERYRQFCVGRARVITQAPPEGFAAATASGIPAPKDQLTLHWIAAANPGIPIENPRQVSAFEYPRDYGPVAPGFSRAMLLPGDAPVLLISGTASIVGHESQHDDTCAQIDEILANVEALVGAAEQRANARADFANDALLRVYLRDPAEAARVRTHLLQRLGANACFMLLHGDVCRDDLRVEIEAALPLRRVVG